MKSAVRIRNFQNPSLFDYASTGGSPMTSTSRGRAQDRARVAGGQDYEVRYEAKKEGVSKNEVKKAIKSVGNSRKKVEGELEEGD
jgi:hypothetical protein